MCVCACCQVLKFADALVPKMGLATWVLRECAVDLLFFGISFMISMLAFSMMLYVQLGPMMQAFQWQFASIVSLSVHHPPPSSLKTRAACPHLFGRLLNNHPRGDRVACPFSPVSYLR